MSLLHTGRPSGCLTGSLVVVHTLVSGGRDAYALTQEDTDYSVVTMTPGQQESPPA